MVIIQMAGGLGNQMFQYALYKQLKSMGKNVKMDDEEGFREDAKREPSLAPFGIVYDRASREEIRKITDSSPSIPAKIRRKLLGRKKRAYFEESKRFQTKIFEWDNIYLEGYWQSEKYFADVAEELRQEYCLEHILRQKEAGYGFSAQAQHYLEQIEQSESVSLHIRRGDYLLPENQTLFGNICTDEYYRQAMERVQKNVPECVFYLFTNDRAWAKEWMQTIQMENPNRKMILVELPDGRDYEELMLMSRCKHNILANSSFSWWASYLNENPAKIVLVPDKWLNGWDCQDIYRADMTKVAAPQTEQTR